jgi:hypothetical protein
MKRYHTLNSARSPELTVKINLKNKNGGASDLGVNFANQSESLASIKELDVVPEKLDSLGEQQQTSTDESKENFNQNTKILTEYGLKSNQENEKSQHVSQYYSIGKDRDKFNKFLNIFFSFSSLKMIRI